ncbi:MAG: CPBP family intramembrane metalloprotease [Crenarchaeota archaeon]|nr:MAG: CPBP family intramembrane metalloprotease [Thermoproteota archaeon]RDJ33837.1 MAG: CPBP family intramembrane metalloprotease [Thermoproteota archaeon]RDJ37053.1 MAG: CPBP family intramembrane metalloprotease [Thermoproteota archaeon]RDJ37412.1 MAG: CPBP family intramembrane metalloprotease [Thermoproteota archaeon]
MEKSNNILQGFGIPYSALISIIFGMMLLSFPIGAFVVFNTDIGNEINFEYPVSGVDFFLTGTQNQIPIQFELGDAFVIIWSIFAVLFAVSMVGPKKNFISTITPALLRGKEQSEDNYLVSAIKWFTVLILISAGITIIQEQFGILTTPPVPQNNLIQFFDVMKAPLIEEFGFRVLLIGIPLFAMYSHRTSVRHFFKSLWNPNSNLNLSEKKKAIALVVIVAAFFGIAHIISGESWSDGKFAQATASGIIIGWAYIRHGLVSAILIHWATNYFVFSYVYLVAELNSVSISNAFSHSMINTIEIMFIIAGVLSSAIMIIKYKQSKTKSTLEI